MTAFILCALVGLVGFFSSYGVWQAVIEKRIVRTKPPKRAARLDPGRKVHRRQAQLAKPKLSGGQR